MIISYDGNQNFTIKTKSKIVKIGQNITLGELEIKTPREYESGGVQVEVIDGIVEVISEKITIAWTKKGKILKDEELERVSGVNILLIGVGGDQFYDTKTAIEVINQIEPAIVIPMYKDNPDEFIKEEGVKGEGQDLLKITFNELPQEERKVIILNPSK